ncbi:uncharacterized protein A1O9_12698, partial [Exophiala aquamarina CBS 119918]
MVKVAENRVNDLDVFPSDPKANKLVDQTQTAVAGKIPQDQAKGITSNTQSAVQALGGTVGGGVKGVVDAVGNTVGTLGEGGVGDGVGSTIQFAGGALGAGAGKVGSMLSGNKSCENALEAQKERLQAATDDTKDIDADLPKAVEENSKDAMTAQRNSSR